MPRKATTPDRLDNPWPHRTAWALIVAALVVTSVGGLVTSYQAWVTMPTSAASGQYDPFSFYPPARWLADKNVLLEHSHRLIGAALGLVATGLALLVWRHDRRVWLLGLALGVAAIVLLEVLLGGLRVWDQGILLAQLHALLGPLLMAMCAALVIVTSQPWRARSGRTGPTRAGRLGWLAWAGAAGIYLQIVLGAQLRHVPPQAPPGWALLWVWLHVATAGLVLLGLVWLLLAVRRRLGQEPMIVRRARWLVGLFVVELGLGAAAWVTSYGWPNWLKDYLWASAYTVVAQGTLQAWITAAQVAVGSLSLAAAVSLGLWILRPPGPVDRDWLALLSARRRRGQAAAAAALLAIAGSLSILPFP